ncbi:MAG: peroxide stress protein YaaA [Saprospiraceae bacterium]|nr:peroxide stress protein YaaA [Saprospiraceae bacterium]
MIVLLSPAKSLDFSPSDFKASSTPRMLEDSEQLVEIMQKKSAKKIGELMSISDKLAKLNKERFDDFHETATIDNEKEAILAFKGDVYVGLENETLSGSDLAWAQSHVRILSGLYGLLRPRDVIRPYRLEMGTRLNTQRGKDLYAFWGDKITEMINEDLKRHKSRVVFNLASKEYFNAVNTDLLEGDLYSANFLERRNGEYKFISFTAKKARGWLCRYIIDNRITDPEAVKEFDREGFRYLKTLSSEREFVFVRKG